MSTAQTQGWLAQTLTSLRYRNFRLVWLGSVTEHWGEWMELVAFMWLARQLTPSPFLIAIAGMSRYFPRIFFPFIGGVVADRFNRRTSLIAALGGAGLFSVALAALVYTGQVQLWHLIAIGMANGVATSFNHPARMAIVPNLVRREHLMNAISLDQLSVMGSSIIGAPMAGIIIDWAGVMPVFLLRAAGLWLAIVWLLMAHIPHTPSATRQQNPWQNLTAGLKYMRQNTVVLTMALLYGVPMLTFFVYHNVIPIIAVDILKISATAYGWLNLSWGLGAAIALLGLASLLGFRSKGKLYLAVFALMAISLFAFGLSHWFWVTFFVLIIYGASRTATMALTDTIVQSSITDEYRGRVVAIKEMMQGITPIGGVAVGLLAEYRGVPYAVGLTGLVVLLFPIAVAILVPKIRRQE